MIEEVATTRLMPAAAAASITFSVPSRAQAISVSARSGRICGIGAAAWISASCPSRIAGQQG